MKDIYEMQDDKPQPPVTEPEKPMPEPETPSDAPDPYPVSDPVPDSEPVPRPPDITPENPPEVIF